ncbi:MAG TPA: type II toxin-antitoxin system prevent-host-death family antitoxin [Thermoanaerobaculia bacterium]|nr:type II toxin-antitoxin system prevent-host-death family antitoxin [Thermoanaerobaculia bacterium]
MATVGARELKLRLGRYLRQVRSGETILVTERGRPIAELRPLSRSALDLDPRLQRLAATGAVRLPTRPKSAHIERVTLPGPPVAQTVVEDREDRF